MAAEAVTIAAGMSKIDVPYTILTDMLMEDIEDFTLTLTITGGGDTETAMNGLVINPSSSTVYIMDCTGRIVIFNDTISYFHLIKMS